ncbi:hypothetical protein BKP35_11230 [Anaerobacillus arseniciselenatis]|uniref:Uncharacterized protein n=2 Tax=Anaerobacillus arseniciselenatis TaxID=85682 RepID=A0A1S2LHA3_9BACI|nr:hypothetical protein BKP35_11230 [Anaerobacillus arseniciselenatis]
MAITVVSMVIGVGILTLPRALAASVETTDGWMSIVLGLVLNMVLVLLIFRLHRHFPGKSFIGLWGNQSVAKWIGKLFSIAFVCYFVTLLAYEARILTVVVRMYLLDRTPSEVTVLFIFLATTYAVTKGVQGIVHLNLMFFPFVVFVITLIVIFNLHDASFGAIFPIAAEGITPIIMGVQETSLSFLGIEILFFFLAYMKGKDLQATLVNAGIAFVAFLYLLIVVMCYMVIGLEVTKIIAFPLVALAKEVEIIEGLVERIEPLMITVWIMSIFNTMAIVHFLATKIIKDEFVKKARVSTIAIVITFFSFIITFIPVSLQEAFMLGDYVSYFGLGLTCFALLCGYLYVFIKKKSKQQGNSEAM